MTRLYHMGRWQIRVGCSVNMRGWLQEGSVDTEDQKQRVHPRSVETPGDLRQKEPDQSHTPAATIYLQPGNVAGKIEGPHVCGKHWPCLKTHNQEK